MEIKLIPGIITSMIEEGAVVESMEKSNWSCKNCLEERCMCFYKWHDTDKNISQKMKVDVFSLLSEPNRANEFEYFLFNNFPRCLNELD